MKAIALAVMLAATGAAAGDDIDVNVTKADKGRLDIDVVENGDVHSASIVGNLGFGADSWDGDLVLSILGTIGAPLSLEGDNDLMIGVRSGVAATGEIALLAVPIDLVVKYSAAPAYFEAIGGPWLFTRAREFRAHLAGGVGVHVGDVVNIGIEAGWLDPHPIVGGRLSFGF